MFNEQLPDLLEYVKNLPGFVCLVGDMNIHFDNTLQSITIITINNYIKSEGHKESYIAWREFEGRPLSNIGVDSLLEVSYQFEAAKWCHVLKRIIDAVIFLAERGLAFSVDHHIGLGIQTMVTC